MKNSDHLTSLAEPFQEELKDDVSLTMGSSEPFSPFDPAANQSAVALMWAHRAFILKATAVALVVSLCLAFVLPKSYDATTRLMPPDSSASPSSGLMAMAMLASQSRPSNLGTMGDLLGLKNTGDLFIGVLESETVQNRLIDRFDLRRSYRTRYYADARKKLATNTEITQDRKNGIVTIVVSDRDPRRAAEMARSYVEELDRTMADLNTSAAHRERVFIEGRLAKVKADLDQSSAAFGDFQSKNMAVDIREQTRAMVDAAATLQGQLIAAESELEGLQQIYSPENVRVKAAKARLSSLQDELRKLGGSRAGGAADPSNSSIDEMYPSIRKLPVLGVKWADLYRQAKLEETVYELLTQQYEIAKIEEAKEIPSVKVLDPPLVPEKKSRPRRWLITVIGALLGLAAGTSWVVGRAMWRDWSDQDARKILVRTVISDLRQVRRPESQTAGRN